MFNWIKAHKAYTLSILFFILALVSNKPETDNGLAMLIFMVSLFSGFMGFIKSCEDDSKYYR